METADLIPNIKRDYILNLAKSGERLDSRGFQDYRKIELETGVIENAEGSARIRLGGTKVIVGIKIETGEPYPDIPDRGVMITSTELIPMASPTFEAGPPRENAIELSRVVDRGIRESEAIEVEKLCIREGELVRLIFVDIHIMDYDGNLFDAAGVAAMAALMNTKMKDLDEEGNLTGELIDLPLRKVAVPCTFAKIGEFLLLDPSLDEERACDSRLTIATEDDGNICAIQKGKAGSFSMKEILEAVKISKLKGAELRALLKSV
ncbi:MAG: exosome complex protein Rrp42 [Candidatus Methanofastidiosia archaeon]